MTRSSRYLGPRQAGVYWREVRLDGNPSEVEWICGARMGDRKPGRRKKEEEIA